MDTGVAAINQGDCLYHEHKEKSVTTAAMAPKGSFQPFDLDWPGT